MPLIFNGTTVEKVIFNRTEVQKVIFNGTEVWSAETAKTIAGKPAWYRGATYPSSYTQSSAAVGPSATSSQGAIVAFAVTAAELASATGDTKVIFKFSSATNLSTVKFARPTAGFVPQLVSGQSGTTAFTNFYNSSGWSLESGYATIDSSGCTITLTIPAATMQGYASNLKTIDGTTYLCFGVMNQYNNPTLVRSGTQMEFSYQG